MGIVATVDLSTGQVHREETDPALQARFLGGRGLAAKILYDRVGIDTGAFDPGNCLIFTTGPFSGTSWPTASRYHVTFKSPATEAYGYANSGGHFGPELARAGYDALVITGRAPQPVYLAIADDEIEIRPAGRLWGQLTSAVYDALLGPAGRSGRNGRVACIGPAGENRARIAAIMNDYGRAAARSGPGAVMGSKNLKAVWVRGMGRTNAPREFASAVRQASQHVLGDPKNAGLMKDGTLFLVRPKNMTGDFPAKNHRLAQAPFVDEMTPESLDHFKVKRLGCEVCPIRCSRISKVGGSEDEMEVEGPELETTEAFGPLCWNASPEVVIRANALCNDYGLDTISTGVVIAFAMECHEHGLLSDRELSLEWGDGPSILGLIERIGRRTGLGDILAEGTRRAAEQIGGGSADFAMQVKGVEMPRQEPRFSKGFGLGHATSNRGADHLYGLPAIDLAGDWPVARRLFDPAIVEQLMDPVDESYKADMLIYGEHFCAITDPLGICKFSTVQNYSLLPDALASGLNVLGIAATEDSLLEIGERIVNLERLYNVREGLSRADDRLPRRIVEEPLTLRATEHDPDTGETRLGSPIATGQLFDFDAMLDRYYDVRGWDRNGRPTAGTLARLSLAQEGQQICQEA